MLPLAEFVQKASPFVVAHRGDSARAPENTTAAFQRAIAAGIPMIELDIQLSKDGELIVIHDPTLERTTNGTGMVHAHTVTHLKQLDAGSWFAPEFANQRLLLLPEALEQLLPHSYVNIEIKPPVLPEHFPLKVQRAAEIVQALDAFPFILFSSFHYPSLQWLHHHFPAAHTAPIRIPGDRTLPSKLLRQYHGAAFVAELHSLSAEDLEDIAHHHIFAAYYTINSEADLYRAIEQHATALVSDNAVHIHQILQQWLERQKLTKRQ